MAIPSAEAGREPLSKPIRRLALTGLLVALPWPAGAETLVDYVRALPRLLTYEEAHYPDRGAAGYLAALRAFLAGEGEDAEGAIAAAGLVVRVVEQDGGRWRLLHHRERSATPIVAVNARPSRDAIIEAPHPARDRATGQQAALFLAALGARAGLIAAHDRCASEIASPCSGRTRVCGGGARRYPVSDPAHNLDSRFHLAHTEFARRWPSAAVVQLHGFGGRDTETLFVLSDGSTERRAPDAGLPARVRDRLRQALGGDATAVSCQDPGDEGYDYRRMCGRTNVQGRQLNGSAESCRKDAATASGRFLHVEQYWSVRRPIRERRATALETPALRALLAALASELPCIAGAEC